jgi:hypothetical protein
LAERGVIQLEVGMWAANAIFLGFGIYLLNKAANESPVLLMVWLSRSVAKLHKGAGSLTRSSG